MLNQKTIIINAFSRGGSNIIWNLLQSHPGVCSPIWETQRVFTYRQRIFNGILISVLSGQPGFFSLNNWELRQPLPGYLMRYIDRCLYQAKLKNLSHPENRFKTEDIEYTVEEVRNSRLVCKNIDGMIFANNVFAQIYPDASFIALVRNGLALLEGHLRRGSSVQPFAQNYVKIMNKIKMDSQAIGNYYILRFEDMVAYPTIFLDQLYKRIGLSTKILYGRVRLKIKKHTQGDGKISSGNLNLGRKYWLDIDNLHNYLNETVNANQIMKLKGQNVRDFMMIAGDTMRRFGYVS